MSTLYPHGGVDASQTAPAAEVGSYLGLLHQITVLGRHIRRILAQRLDQTGLNDSEFLLLWVCSQGGAEGTAQVRLAASTALSTAQVSGLVERLRGRGLIRECPSPTDRRRRQWQLTVAGREKLDAALAALASLTAAREGQFDLPAMAKLAEFLEPVHRLVTAAAGDDGRSPPLRVFPHREDVAGHAQAGQGDAP